MVLNEVKKLKHESNIHKSHLLKELYRYRYLYLMFLPALILLAIFKYGPMYGIQIGFRDYRFADGIWGSEFVGLKYFIRMFAEKTFLTVLRNTLVISFLKLIVVFPAGIIFALFLNEIQSTKLKKVTQTISYLPHFLSWVVIAGILKVTLSMDGPVNLIVEMLGGDKQLWLTKSGVFVPILVLSQMWQEMGWGSIIFLAAITGISKELYEAADIDGASRIQRMMYITLPSLVPVIMILLLLRVGHLLEAGFEQVLNLQSPLVMGVGDIIDTYMYRVGLVKNMDFSYSTAIGLFKNVVGVCLMLTVNFLTKRTNEYGL